jgi:hypothetical protein
MRTPILTRDASHKVKSLNNTIKVLIAFALVERTETDNMSPASSRSSRSFDRTVEYIDILRIHSVVQAFFMETLAEEKDQLYFWLERSASVFCRSFDEAHHKIQGDANVGLSDDYRRYAVHGRRLQEHLHRHVKRGPQQIVDALDDVEDRLEQIQQSIQRLSLTAQTSILNGGYGGNAGGVVPASVFERASSLSETDSATPSSHRSLTASDKDSWAPSDGPGQMVQSPAEWSPHDVNPYHFHVPYPHRGTIPALPYQGDDSGDDATEMPGTPGTPRRPTPPSPYPARTRTTSGDGWIRVGPRHRTIQKSELRRYHDRGGAWRNQGVGDPRISVSREIAKGSVFRPDSPSSQGGGKGKGKVTAGSEAEVTLNEIRKVSSPPQRSAVLAQHGETGRSSPARPEAVLQHNSYADVASGKTKEEDYVMSPTEFSNGFLKSSAATLKRLRENILPSRKKSGETSKPAAPVRAPSQSASSPTAAPNTSPRKHRHSNSELIGTSPSPMFLGARSANSSPGPAQQPFSPPPVSRSDLPSSVHQWQTQVYHPGRGHLDSSDIGHGIAPYEINVHPPPHARGPVDGYTSEPMTRDPSAQSNLARPAQPHPSTRHSPPSPRSLPLRGVRRSSFVETEPSPQTGNAFDVHTSYERWEERYRRRRAGSATNPRRSTHLARVDARSASPMRRRPLEINFQPGSAGGEDMARSGSSGGIKLLDGRIIEFGKVGVDIEEARRRASGFGRDEREVSPSEEYAPWGDVTDEEAERREAGEEDEGDEGNEGGEVGLGITE